MRKIPPKAEASNILVGEMECLEKTVSCFIRLNESCNLGDLTEVPVPTRFIFVLLGPSGYGVKYHEIGRSMATLLSDEVIFFSTVNLSKCGTISILNVWYNKLFKCCTYNKSFKMWYLFK